jgi:signal transduction histidine kinase
MAIEAQSNSVRSSLLAKIFSVFTLLTAIIFTVLCSLYMVIQVKEKKAYLAKNLGQETRNLAELIRLPLYAENQDILRREAENAFRLPEMRAVVITSAYGKVLVNLHSSAQVEADGIISSTEPVFSGNHSLSVEETLVGNTDPKPVLIGSVRLDRATSDLSRDIRHFVVYSAGLALICWLAMLGAFYLILCKFTASFNELMHGLDHMLHGDYSTRIRIVSHDEPARAAHALNILAEKLHDRDVETLRLNNKLRESEQNLKTLLANSVRDTQVRLSMASTNALLFAWDIDLATGTISYSDGVECAFNSDSLSEDFFVLWKFTVHIHDEDLDRVKQLAARATSNAGPIDGQFRVNVSGDHYIWIEVHGKVICNSQGAPVRVVGIGQNISERKRLEVAQRRVNALAQDLAVAEERERYRIAEELHDQVGPNLLLCMMKLDSLHTQLPDDRYNDTIESIENILGGSIQEIRSLTFQLRPPILSTAGFTPALKWLASEFREKFGLEVTITDNTVQLLMDFGTRSTLFQVVRELLLNVVKHAGTNQVTITIDQNSGNIIVRVRDEGLGFDPESKLVPKSDTQGFGMFNIRQKIEHVGGSIWFDSRPEAGTLVTVTVPERDISESAGESA